MERDRNGAGDVGHDHRRDFGDQPPPAIRDAAPDYLGPIDETAPVSGHVPAPVRTGSPADTPEHDWGAASAIVMPLLRPVGTVGLSLETVDLAALAAQTGSSHGQQLVDEGPCDLVVVYALKADGYDVIANGEHLLAWGIDATAIQDAAIRNLSGWSAAAPWTDEASGERRLLSSDTGDGWDASRILLPEVREHLAAELGPAGRVLIGVPERHLLVAGSLRSSDAEFADLFRTFVVEHSGAADEPIDRRVFELVDGNLVEFED